MLFATQLARFAPAESHLSGACSSASRKSVVRPAYPMYDKQVWSYLEYNVVGHQGECLIWPLEAGLLLWITEHQKQHHQQQQ